MNGIGAPSSLRRGPTSAVNLSAKVQLVGCTFAPPFLLPAITPLLLGVSWGVLAELARLVGPRVYVEFPRPRTRIELGGVGGTRAKEHQNPHFLTQGVDWWLPD